MYTVTELASSVLSTLSGRHDCHAVIRDAGGCRVLSNMLDPALDSKVVEDVATAVGNLAADGLCRAALQRDGVVTALLNLLRPSRPKRIRVRVRRAWVHCAWCWWESLELAGLGG